MVNLNKKFISVLFFLAIFGFVVTILDSNNKREIESGTETTSTINSTFNQYLAQNLKAESENGCIPDGWADDTLYKTSCCSGQAVRGSTYCHNPEDWNTTWESCYQICGATTEDNVCPFGPVGSPWCPCPKGTSPDGSFRQGSCLLNDNLKD